MSKIKNSDLDQYDAEPFEQQLFGTTGVEGVKCAAVCSTTSSKWWRCYNNHKKPKTWVFVETMNN